MQSSNYFPRLDGLRAIACLSVIFFHSSLIANNKSSFYFIPFKGGYLGVDLFFVLSGFLITNILLNQYIKFGSISFKKFYYKRILRLYPPIIVASIIFIIPYFFYNPQEALSNLFFLLTYTGDVVKLFQMLFPSLLYPLYFSHIWSLAIEEQFYLFYPFLFSFLISRSLKKNKNIISTFWLYLLLFFVLMLVFPLILKAWFYKFFLWRFFEIFFGCYLAVLLNEKYSERFSIHNATGKFLISFFSNSWIVIISVLSFILLLSTFPPTSGYWHYIFFTIISTSLIFVCVKYKKTMFDFVLLNSKMIYIGKISYGLYLFHWPIFFLIGKFNFLNLSKSNSGYFIKDLLGIGCTFLIAVLSYILVERKFLLFKNKL